MLNLDDVVELARPEKFLAVVSTVRADGTVQSSVVNAGVLADHRWADDPIVGFVTYGRTKLANLRERPAVTVTFRAGWQWITVEGTAWIVGPDDPAPDFDGERLRVLLREVFVAAGGEHDNWEVYDRTMVEDGRAAVLVRPVRIYSNRRRD